MKFFPFVAAAVFLFGCNTADQVPANLLTKAEMTKILTDLHYGEAIITNQYYQSDSAMLIYKALENKVFAQNKTDSATFFQSYAWYSFELEQLDQIYAAVVDSLALREAIFRNE